MFLMMSGNSLDAVRVLVSTHEEVARAADKIRKTKYNTWVAHFYKNEIVIKIGYQLTRKSIQQRLRIMIKAPYENRCIWYGDLIEITKKHCKEY